MDKDQKIMSFPELMEARRENMKDVAVFLIDDPTHVRGYDESMRLAGRIQGVIKAYESATTPKDRYKAGSELCRLVDRISGGTAVAQGIQNGDKRYVAHVRRDGEYRIPELRVVEGISPAQISEIEFNEIFADKSLSYPGTTSMDPELKDVLTRAVFLGISDGLAKAYNSAVKLNHKYHSGVKKE